MFKRSGIVMLVVAMLLLLAVPAALAGPNGTDRPLEGSAIGHARYGYEGGGTDGLLNVFDCDEAAPDKLPPGFDPGIPLEEFREFFRVMTYTSADGTLSHLGTVHMESVHCPNPFLGPVNGQIGIVAANGDVLYGEYQGNGDVIVIEFKPQSTMNRSCQLLNGVPCESTGRFADVSGTATWFADAMPGSEEDPFVPWPWWGDWTGLLSY